MQPASDVRRVLLAILVYNGQDFVPRCLESAHRLADHTPGVDVLALDDCSPEPGWSEKLRELCEELGIGYYRSPRNLGIPRNMNLGLLRGRAGGYDHVVILNSDVILPQNLVEVLAGVAEANQRVGSVTAWSNNCSIYSLPNADPYQYLRDPKVVDWVSDVLGGEFGPAGVEIPASVGFCMLIPTATLEAVGLFDPVFGRGYCEELDWCLRAQARGFRNLLAPNGFVYHQGSGSTRDAGLLNVGETTVSAHEQIIDWRYPLFRQQVQAFLSSDIPSMMKGDGLRRIVSCAARELGYDIETALSSDRPRMINRVQVFVPEGTSVDRVIARYIGFEAEFPLPAGQPILEVVEGLFDRRPERIFLYGRGTVTRQLAAEAARGNDQVHDRLGYPETLGPQW
jgi:GT2 family glycosyltransferase